MVRLVALTFLPLTFVAAVFFSFLLLHDLSEAPDIAFMEHYHHGAPVEVYDREDELICVINPGQNRKVVALNEISNEMKQAVLAVEDRQFFEHRGVSIMGVTRAILANVKAGRPVQGGSTITQQLVKILFFEGEKRTIVRKVSEAILATMIEARYTKEQILKTYLNEIYFGNGAYGVEQAARVYFGKSAARLNVGESAFLAGLIKSPSYYGDPLHRQEALQRQQQVLRLMNENGYISDDQHAYAMVSPLVIYTTPIVVKELPFTKYPYFISYLLDVLRTNDPGAGTESAARRGLRIYTTLDQEAQKSAENYLASGIARAPQGITEGALVSLSVFDGSIRALVGGAGDYWQNQWNCATNPHTAGSAFKPFVYLAAFRKGVLDPASIVEDTKLAVPQIGGETYCPKNFDGKFLGKITVREALTQSRNVCSVRVYRQVGSDIVLETARLAGIKTPLDPNLSLALGSSSVTPLEMASAYGTLARGGMSIEPWAVRRVETLDGRVLRTYEPVQCRALEPEPVFLLNSILEDVVKKGTGTAARLTKHAVAGKTGTADNSTDLWFVGFTPEVVTAVWAGSKDHSAIKSKRVTGGTVAARIFHDFMESYYKKHPGPVGHILSKEAASKPAAPAEKPEGKEETSPTPVIALRKPEPRAVHPPRARRQKARKRPTDAQLRYAEYLRYYSRRTSSPRNGVIMRAQKGVTDYRWWR